MSENRMEKPELIARVARRTGQEKGTVEEILEAALEEIHQALKQGEAVSLRNFSTVYVRPERASIVGSADEAVRARLGQPASATLRIVPAERLFSQ